MTHEIKRIVDLFLSIAALVTLFPVLLVVGLLIRLKLGSPVIYKAQRVGFKSHVFTLYKFRSMTDETDHTGELLPDEARLTKFGEFLRKSSLDELPGLFNVIMGDMAIVGPRPLSNLYKDMYSAHQNQRHDVRPGITGWSQVNGRNNLSWEEKFELDVWYVKNGNLMLDAKIILKTVQIVFAMSDVNQKGHVTAPPWMGTPVELSPMDKGSKKTESLSKSESETEQTT